jgi:TetR/AcrR family transcriptional repressor of nem operon
MLRGRKKPMRMSREAKARHHEEIVQAAAKLLRKNGIGGTSVSDLMQAAGLTHGGFYRHFDSKTALVAEASQEAFDQFVSGLDVRTSKAGTAKVVSEYIDRYLSPEHVNKPGRGCPLATLGIEAGREDKSVRSVFAANTDRLFAAVGRGLSGKDTEKREKAIRLVASMVGAVILARAVGNRALADEILEACRSSKDR